MSSAMQFSSEDDFNNFAAPVPNAPLPRWKRKALEASHAANRPATPSNSKSRHAKTPKSAHSAKRGRTPRADRFIPNRSAMDMDMCRLALTFDAGKENGSSQPTPDGMSPSRAAEIDVVRQRQSAGYSSVLASSLLDIPATPNVSADLGDHGGSNILGSKILAFSGKAPEPKEGYRNTNRVLYSQNAMGPAVRRNKFRYISKNPEKILDAPALLEDYYLNLLDWGSNNVLAVALGETVYLWNAQSGAITQLCETSDVDDCITSVSWMPDRNHIAVGTNRHEVQIWDTDRMACVRKMRSHTGRVGALAWNGHILSSGSRDAQIHNHDVRIPQHHVATLAHHEQEVCGLKWSPNGTQLASGGNDNIVCVWDNQHSSRWTPKHTFDHHTAAVKALAWCPWQTNLLATGGGTADRHLRFWNTSSGACVNSIDTKSQVCAIVWSPHDKELVTSHGFSQNQLTVWKYPSLARMAELKGHTSRVLHMGLSPDGQTVVSGAADETLRFWKIFAGDDSRRAATGPSHSGKGGLSSTSRGLGRSQHIR